MGGPGAPSLAGGAGANPERRADAVRLWALIGRDVTPRAAGDAGRTLRAGLCMGVQQRGPAVNDALGAIRRIWARRYPAARAESGT